MNQFPNNWDNPVFDRTPDDIKSDDPQTYEKAFLNAKDLNRIESNTAIVAQALQVQGYRLMGLMLRADPWEMSDIPTTGQIDRICQNIIALGQSYYGRNWTAELVATSERLDYNDINRVEENLLFLKEMLERMVAGFKRSDTFYASKNALPSTLLFCQKEENNK